MSYRLKRVAFRDRRVPIVLQSEGQCCSLLAVANTLLLRGDITIHEDQAVLTADELLSRVGEYLLESNMAANNDDTFRANNEQNINDVIQMLPKTQQGIDVNMKFRSISAFEYTPECVIFDLCNIRLVHGWLVDPQDDELFNFVHNLSYNQIVEKQIKMQSLSDTNIVKRIENLSIVDNNNNNNNSEKNVLSEDEMTNITKEGLLAERFLSENSTQLTYFGLSELHAGVKEEELCVFFRNNHFCTMYKRNGELFLLVTDQGYENSPIVWEKLCQIDGDNILLKSDFTSYQAESPALMPELPVLVEDNAESIDQTLTEIEDMKLAMALQEEEMAASGHHHNQQRNHHQKSPRKEIPKSKEKDKKRRSKGDCVLQ